MQGKGGGGLDVTSPPLRTAKVKETPLAREGGPDGRNSKALWLSTTSSGCIIYRLWSQTFFKGGGGERDEFGWALPLALAAMFPWKRGRDRMYLTLTT